MIRLKTSVNIVLLSILLILIFLAGCNKDKGPYIPVTIVSRIDSISFSLEIQPIFNFYCTACHNNTHPKLNLQTCCSYDQLWSSGFSAPYLDTVSPKSSLLYKHVSGQLSIMPPTGSIPTPEISSILKWIEQKARKN